MPQNPLRKQDKDERVTFATSLRAFGFSLCEIGDLVNRDSCTVYTWLNPHLQDRKRDYDRQYRNTNKAAQLERCREWYGKNAATERISSRNRQATLYGYMPANITAEQETWLREREKTCQLCGRHECEFKKGLTTDHDHNTGNVRGRICPGCNAKIAVLDFCEDNAEWLAKAGYYRNSVYDFSQCQS